ncbi:MAG: TIGR02266 family protein [Myxococcota bacterium]|nr:TIGR02266 family protein [Myxococcota bacterium]
MSFTGEQLEATAQLDRARAALGEALGQTQDIDNTGLDVTEVSASLAGAVKSIFTIQSSGIRDPQSFIEITSAMDHLRDTLKALQDVQSDNPALVLVTSTVARILALLYPISKLMEKMAEARASASELPIPLTPRKSTPPTSDAPIPLVPSRPGRPSRPASDIEENRRSSERRSIAVDIGIHSSTNFFTGFSQDISSGGLFVATFDTLAIGTKLTVNFNLPDGPVLSLDGMVRWVREYNEITPEMEPGMGIQFEDLPKNDRDAINQFMVKYPPIFFEDE